MSESDDGVPLVTRRIGLLRSVNEGASTRGEVAATVDVSRSTVDRGVRELTDAGFIEQRDGCLHPTLAGRLALNAHDEMTRRLSAVTSARELLAPLPPETELPVEVLVGARVETAGEGDPFEPVRRLLAGESVVRGLWSVGDHASLLFDGDLDRPDRCELGLHPDLVERLVVDHPDRLADLLDAGAVELRQLTDPPRYDLSLVQRSGSGDAGGPRVAIVVTDGGDLRGSILTDREEAVTWAGDVFQAAWNDATRLTDRE